LTRYVCEFVFVQMFGSNCFVQWAGAVGQNSPCRTGIKITHTHTHTQILSFDFN